MQYRSPAGRERKQIEVGQRKPRGGLSSATDIVNHRFGRLGADRAINHPHGVVVLESPVGGSADPATGRDQRELAHLDLLAALLPDLAHHSPVRSLFGIETAAGQTPVTWRAGPVGELRHQKSARAGHHGVGRHALVPKYGVALAHDLVGTVLAQASVDSGRQRRGRLGLNQGRLNHKSHCQHVFVDRVPHDVSHPPYLPAVHREKRRRVVSMTERQTGTLRILQVDAHHDEPARRQETGGQRAATCPAPATAMARRYSASAPSRIRPQDCSGWVLRLYAVIDSRSPSSMTRAASDLAMASSSAARYPCRPSLTNSCTPLPRRPTTGSPTVRASSAAIPNDSRGAGATKMSEAAYLSRSSSRVTRPGSRTQLLIS